jgi:hypothetical protein
VDAMAFVFGQVAWHVGLRRDCREILA